MLWLTAAALLSDSLVQSQGLLEVLSPPSSIKMDNIQHSKIPRDTGYQIG